MAAVHKTKRVRQIIDQIIALGVICRRMKNKQEYVILELIEAMRQFELRYAEAVSAYNALENSGVTRSEMNALFSQEIHPAVQTQSVFNNINVAKNALTQSFGQDVWPEFEGKAFELSAGNVIEHSIPKPAAFDTALGNMISALEDIIEG